jgi:hypothetical protein
MRTGRATRERGAALLVLVAAVALAASWLLVKQLNAESGSMDAIRKTRNAEVLQKAKQALIGYVAVQTAQTNRTSPSTSYENDPGALPCPEAAGNFGDSSTEGTAAGFCTLPAVGRLPWRTLGIDKLVDASGEPLWYVVATGWAKPSTTANTVINSNCASTASGMACATSQLTVDGAANDAVALIIAPGPAFTVPAATGCTAWTQVRASTGTPDWRNYLECENATNPADSTFVTTGPSGSFNDQVLRITVADVMPAIEAAIASRIEREIVPILTSAYAAPNWGLTGSDKVYPYAAPFANPDTSSFTGSSATTRGHLPLVHTESYPGSLVACTAGAADPRCNTSLVTWSNASPTVSYTNIVLPVTSACSYAGPTSWASCNGTYAGIGAAPRITVSGPQSNGAMSLRATNSVTGFVLYIDPLAPAPGFTLLQPLPSVTLNNNGTFTVSITATPPAPLGIAVVQWWIFVPGNATSDHSLLDVRASSASPTPASTSWFMRNEWHKLTHYAAASGYTAVGAAPRSCTTASTCLTVTNVTPAGGQRALLILAGRSINGTTRPSATLANYLDFSNATATGTAALPYERQSVSKATNAALKSPFNDRIVVIDANP